MRVLVTGGAGFIGSHTCKLLASLGHEPIVLDNLSTGHRSAAKFGPLVEGDIADRAVVGGALTTWRPEAVIHFAASAYVGDSMREPLSYYRNNVAGTLTLVEEMARVGVGRLVFSSSCATYGIPDSLPIHEDMRQAPINPYGETKLACEWLIRAQCAAGRLRAIALRYFNAAGADPDGELGELHEPETHLIPLALRATLPDAPPLQVYGTDYPTADGTCVRDYLHVTDLAQAHIAALDALAAVDGFRTFNLGTGSGHSVREVIEGASRVAGSPVAVRWAERRPGDPPILIADPRKANIELNWRPRHSSLDFMLRSAWQWMGATGERLVSNRIPASAVHSNE